MMFSSMSAATNRWVNGPNGELPPSSLPLVKLCSSAFCLVQWRMYGQVRDDAGIAEIKVGEKHTYHDYHTIHSQTPQTLYSGGSKRSFNWMQSLDPQKTRKYHISLTQCNHFTSIIFNSYSSIWFENGSCCSNYGQLKVRSHRALGLASNPLWVFQC